MVTMVLVHALPGPDAWERVENAHALHLSLNANLLADTTRGRGWRMHMHCVNCTSA